MFKGVGLRYPKGSGQDLAPYLICNPNSSLSPFLWLWTVSNSRQYDIMTVTSYPWTEFTVFRDRGQYLQGTVSCTPTIPSKESDTQSLLTLLKRQSQQLSSALSSAGYFKSHYCKQCGPRSDCSFRSSLIWVHTVCLYAKCKFEKFARRCSRRHKQTTFSDADVLGALRVN